MHFYTESLSVYSHHVGSAVSQPSNAMPGFEPLNLHAAGRRANRSSVVDPDPGRIGIICRIGIGIQDLTIRNLICIQFIQM
jgi:hypothetical protein